MMITEINVARPQCPVGLNTLMLPTKSAAIASDRQPYVYISCGHVHGQHSWGRDSNDNTRTCPMCMMVRRCIFAIIIIIISRVRALRYMRRIRRCIIMCTARTICQTAAWPGNERVC